MSPIFSAEALFFGKSHQTTGGGDTMTNTARKKTATIKKASEVKCTVVVVGDSRVGKTALIQRFVNKTFKQVNAFKDYTKQFSVQYT